MEHLPSAPVLVLLGMVAAAAAAVLMAIAAAVTAQPRFHQEDR